MTQRKPALRGHSFLPRLEILEDRTVLSAWTVASAADSGAGSLRGAIAAAQGGDRIVFDQSLQGQTITLTSGELAISKDLDIDGPGADQLAISGNHASRVFDISGGATVTIAGLTITDGLAVGAPGTGGGIEDIGSNLTVVSDVFSNNEALGVGQTARGGAIHTATGATLAVAHTLFLHNQAIASNNQPVGSNAAYGGGIFTQDSVVTVTDTTFLGNLAHGGDNGQSGTALGGGISNQSRLTVTNCAFTGNQAIGGSGNMNSGNFVGLSGGGGIAGFDGGVLSVTGTAFTDNQAIGGSNNTNTTGASSPGCAFGGGLSTTFEVASVADSMFEHNQAVGGSGNMGSGGFVQVGCAFGGAIVTGGAGSLRTTPAVLTASKLTLCNNRAVGGADNSSGAYLGEAIGGGFCNDGNKLGASTATMSDCMIANNQAIGLQGADGGNSADALGGGIANAFGGVLNVSDSTVTANQALGGAGGSGGNGGNGLGGGFFNDGPSTAPLSLGAPTILTVLGATVTDNKARGGAAGAGTSSAGLGAGGGISSAGILSVLGSSLAHNWAIGSDGESGANGGDGLGGGLYISDGTASVLSTVIDHDRALGGDGDAASNGGNGLGGGVYVAAGTVLLVASEISYNQALGGLGDGDGTDGQGVGGGVYNLGTFLFDASSVIDHNHASTSNDDHFDG
jgi:hypothetical protein